MTVLQTLVGDAGVWHCVELLEQPVARLLRQDGGVARREAEEESAVALMSARLKSQERESADRCLNMHLESVVRTATWPLTRQSHSACTHARSIDSTPSRQIVLRSVTSRMRVRKAVEVRLNRRVPIVQLRAEVSKCGTNTKDGTNFDG